MVAHLRYPALVIAIWVDPNLPAAASFITLAGARIYLLPHVQAPVTVLTAAVVHRAGPTALLIVLLHRVLVSSTG